MSKTDFHLIDRALVRKWNRLGRGKREKFYFDMIRPQITSLLEKQIRVKEKAGIIPKYQDLVLILGHDVNPALIIINSLKPLRLFLLYTTKNEKNLKKRLIPAIDSAIPADKVEYILLEINDHEKNIKKMKELLKNLPGDTALCDITGGKKITSLQLGMAANELGVDISYLDSKSYVEGTGIPVPGEELIYINNSISRRITEISSNVPYRLLISYIGQTRDIIYNLDLVHRSLKFTREDMSASTIEVIKEDIDTMFKKINKDIYDKKDCMQEMNDLADIIRSMLIPHELDEMLKTTRLDDFRLLVDPEVSGIPWEIAFNRMYNTPLPLFRMYNLDFEHRPGKTVEEKQGLLIITGSGREIPEFDATLQSIKEFLNDLPVKSKMVSAESRGALQREFGKFHYDTVIFFGHSVFDKDREKTGWLCKNDEIFCCESLEGISMMPPDVVISNSCHSARSVPFSDHSFGYDLVEAGVRTYIGTNWFLEFERSRLFLSTFIDRMIARGKTPSASFEETISALQNQFGKDDISRYNYIYYGE